MPSAPTPLDLFEQFWPVGEMTVHVEATNEEIKREYYAPGKGNKKKGRGTPPYIDDKEYRHFLGCILTLTLRDGPRQAAWSTTSSGGILPPFHLGRFGMCRDRFDQILRCWRLRKMPSDDEPDPWYMTRGFVKAWNEHVDKNFDPSWKIVPDESMFFFYGRGMPHLSFIARKPRALGCEAKSVADAVTRILFFIEIQEGKVPMSRLEYHTQYGATTACTLRLVKNWKGTNRVVVGDSWFASLKCARALKDELGLYFLGMVKTNHGGFPKKWLQDECGQTRGDWCSAVTAEGDVYAVGWYDKCVKTLVATCSTTLEGQPAHKKRHDNFGKRLPDRLVKCPMAFNEYYQGMPSVDINNHLRQAGVCVEESLRLLGEHAWWRRIVSCIFGISETNSYLAAKAFYPALYGKTSHKQFTELLAMQLMGQRIHMEKMSTINEDEDDAEDDDAEDSGAGSAARVTMSSGGAGGSGVHAIGKFSDLYSGPADAKGKREYDKDRDLSRQQKCIYCLRVSKVKQHTSYYCKLCAGLVDSPSRAALCLSEERQCYALHICLGMPAPRDADDS